MTWRAGAVGALTTVLVGCAARCPEPTAPPAGATAAAGDHGAGATAPEASAAQQHAGSEQTVTEPTPPAAPSVAAEPAPPPAPPAAGSLPEVLIENVGLHIGGGPNDDATKAPFKAAIEKRFDDFRRCYVHAEDPRKGGTFGVDLRIGREGGRAQVQQPRTGMKGTELRACLVRAFESVEFARPARGPTMISYSLRFTLEG